MRRQAVLWAAVLLCSTLASLPAPGQDSEVDTTDFEGWSSMEIRYRIDNRWMISAEEQLRLKSNISEVDKYFTQLGLRYRSPHRITLDGAYRWIRRNDTQGKIQGYESQSRYHFSAEYGHKAGRFSLAGRVRFQSLEEDESDTDEESEDHLRFRGRVRYNVPDWKLDPTFDAEVYRAVGQEGESRFDKVRFTLGTDWELWGESEMGVYYRIERELGVDSPATSHIIGLGITYTLGRD